MALAAEEGIAHVYLGFSIRDCSKTAYKAGFAPFELLSRSRGWLRPIR
jgi:arginyl-tRNA--protein-N-Asp/Glu arginylyltransferase